MFGSETGVGTQTTPGELGSGKLGFTNIKISVQS
jgi:hypothetical protein